MEESDSRDETSGATFLELSSKRCLRTAVCAPSRRMSSVGQLKTVKHRHDPGLYPFLLVLRLVLEGTDERKGAS